MSFSITSGIEIPSSMILGSVMSCNGTSRRTNVRRYNAERCNVAQSNVKRCGVGGYEVSSKVM